MFCYNYPVQLDGCWHNFLSEVLHINIPYTSTYLYNIIQLKFALTFSNVRFHCVLSTYSSLNVCHATALTMPEHCSTSVANISISSPFLFSIIYVTIPSMQKANSPRTRSKACVFIIGLGTYPFIHSFCLDAQCSSKYWISCAAITQDFIIDEYKFYYSLYATLMSHCA